MKPKMTARTHRHGPRKWRESFNVWIEFIGDRSQVGPLLDFIAGSASDGGGTFLIGPPISDQSWTFRGTRNYRQPRGSIVNPSPSHRANECFDRLKAAANFANFSPYIRLRLLHDDKPDRCEPLLVPVGKNPVKHYPLSEGGGHDIAVRRGRGPIVVRKYQRGKLPQIPVRKMRTGKKGAHPDGKR